MASRAARRLAPTPFAAKIAVVALALIAGREAASPTAAAAAPPPADADPLVATRRDHARRLAEVAGAAREARLGTVALRLYQDAHAFDPGNEDARTALGWTRSAAG